jgi:hypothetical protein
MEKNDPMAGSPPSLADRIIAGIKGGMDRQWRYAKDLLKIRPEYLITISVADSIIEGFDDVNGIDVIVRLEVSTWEARRDLVLNKVGWNDYFQSIIDKITRNGWLDIYVHTPPADYIVEINNIDPSRAEIVKEVVRLGQLLLINKGHNHCRTYYIAFPKLVSEMGNVRDAVQASIDPRLSFDCPEPEPVRTDEDPENGVPVYFPVCITLTRKSG